jgi:hypothetical protein
MLALYPHQKGALQQTEDKNKVAIEGFEGLYEIDTQGNVYSILQTRSRRKGILKQYQNEHGYMKVNLYDLQGRCKKKYVHRLVASAFIPNPENKKVVNHKDCNVKNNNVDNLEWMTQSENILYAVKLGRYVDNISKYNNRKKVI